MKKYWKYITLLLVIIIVCTFISSIGRKEMFTEDKSYKCKDLIIKIMTSQGKSETIAKSELDAILEVEPSEYAKIMGIDYSNIPKEMRNRLPKLNLGEMILQMKRNVLLDESGNDVPIDTCVLPVSYLAKMTKHTPSDVMLINGNTYDKISNDTKVCKIFDFKLRSNIKNNHTDDISALNRMNPKQDRMHYFGCIIDYKNLLQLRNILIKLFKYSDMETMRQIRNLMIEYNVTWADRTEAQNYNLESQRELSKENALRVAAQRKVPPDVAILNEQIRATQDSTRELQDSEYTNSFYSNIIYSSDAITNRL